MVPPNNPLHLDTMKRLTRRSFLAASAAMGASIFTMGILTSLPAMSEASLTDEHWFRAHQIEINRILAAHEIERLSEITRKQHRKQQTQDKGVMHAQR